MFCIRLRILGWLGGVCNNSVYSLAARKNEHRIRKSLLHMARNITNKDRLCEKRAAIYPYSLCNYPSNLCHGANVGGANLVFALEYEVAALPRHDLFGSDSTPKRTNDLLFGCPAA
uniref:Uncharacterized protein n=1 Tax=Candidatus Kentrum sp. DK TaxID=2126562 RepID=A0A450RWW3_9GAMM|nr:MAG: hypothetical protein BECKDK2373C_GA0170839_10067 [Candidatus Kentron sp. DK]